MAFKPLPEQYKEDVVPALMDEFQYKSVMQVPRLQKIVVNVGLGEALDNPKAIDFATNDIMAITGQKPVVTRAKKSIASFKLREGRSIGLKVTLRGERMWSFLARLIHVALPRTRDFQGISPDSFDGRGNYTHNPSGVYVDGTEVNFAAYPDDDAEFYGWSGCVTGAVKSVCLKMSEDEDLMAHFTPVPEPCMLVAAAILLLPAARRVFRG